MSFDILHRAGHPQARDKEAFLRRVNGFDPGWEGFAAALTLLDRCMMDRVSVVRVVADIVARAAEQNVKILEPTFSPSEFKLLESPMADLRPFTEAVIDGIEKGVRGRDIAVGLRMLIRPRHLTDAFRETWGPIEEHVKAYRQHLVGVDICTLDRMVPERHHPRRLRELSDFVRASGLHLSAHAAEFFDAEPAARALDLGVERIGHGITIAGDEEVLERVKAAGVTLEVCPVSNYRTGALPPNGEHPLGRLLRAGVRVTINSDDQGVQGSDWEADYRFATDRVGLTQDEVGRCLATAWEASFLSAEEKERYRALFEADVGPPC